jgi:hypothetical protein
MIRSGEGFDVSAGRFTVAGRSPPTMKGLSAAIAGVAITVREIAIAIRRLVRVKATRQI